MENLEPKDEIILQLEQLARLMVERGLLSAELKLSNGSVRLKRAPEATAVPESIPPLFYSAALEKPVASESQEATSWQPKQVEIPSPFVGYFRKAPLESGTRLERGQTIGTIEVLGFPNEVHTPLPGILLEWKVGDGEPVEYGQPIALIESILEETGF